MLIQFSLDTKFKIYPKNIIQVKADKKKNITIKFCIVELVYVSNLRLNWQL